MPEFVLLIAIALIAMSCTEQGGAPSTPPTAPPIDSKPAPTTSTDRKTESLEVQKSARNPTQTLATILSAIKEGKHIGLWEVQSIEEPDGNIEFQKDVLQFKITNATISLLKDYYGLRLQYLEQGTLLTVNADEYRKYIDKNSNWTWSFEITYIDDSKLELKNNNVSKNPVIWHLTRVEATKERDVEIEKSLAEQEADREKGAKAARMAPPEALEAYDMRSTQHPRGGEFVPLMWHSTFQIWTRKFKTLSDTMKGGAVLLRTERDERLGEETARLPLAMQSKAGSYPVHFVRRGHVLPDGSFLFVVVEGTNAGTPYRNSYVIHTDQSLNPDSKYGKNGFFGLESDRSRRGYRYIKNFRNIADGVLATEWRCISEGQADYGECDCYDFKLNSRGQRDHAYGLKRLSQCN